MLEQKDLQTIAELIDARLTKTDDKLEELSRRIGALESRMNALESRMNALESRMDALESRMDALEEKFAALERRVDALEAKVDALNIRINDVERNLSNELVRTEDKLCRRIGRIEMSIEVFKQYFKLNIVDSEDVALTLQLHKVANG